MSREEQDQAALDQLTAANKKINSAMASMDQLLADLDTERAKTAYLSDLLERLGFGMMSLMQKHKYPQVRVTLQQMRLNQNAGNRLNIEEEEASECFKFAIVQTPFSYEEHLNEFKESANQSVGVPSGHQCSAESGK